MSADDPAVVEAEHRVINRLDALDIAYEMFHHRPVATVAEALEVSAEIPGTHVKNLFLRDKKKNYYLMTAEYQAQIDLKTVRHSLQASGNLSFGSAGDLWQILNVRPGSVNPFALMFAETKPIRFFLDETLYNSAHINLHPMRNDKSLTLKTQDLLRFLQKIPFAINRIDLT